MFQDIVPKMMSKEAPSASSSSSSKDDTATVVEPSSSPPPPKDDVATDVEPSSSSSSPKDVVSDIGAAEIVAQESQPQNVESNTTTNDAASIGPPVYIPTWKKPEAAERPFDIPAQN